MSKNIKLNNTNYNGVSTVQLPTTEGGTATFKDTDEITVPSGTKIITENGTYDVSNYASAEVNVESEGGDSGSEDFIGIQYLDFDEEQLPTVADARSIISEYAPTFRNVTNNAGYNINLEKIYLNNSVTKFLDYAFSGCSKLKSIEYDFSRVTTLPNYIFDTCTSLTEFPYMPNLTKLSTNTFRACTGLTEVRFYSTPSTIMNNSFNACENITDIYVPWAEGEVANAPWGATNATIHYGTTYDANHDPIV